jgi:hypothetical protein
LIYLYNYYCKFQKLYCDLSFSVILDPLDVNSIKNIDINVFIKEMKKLSKVDYGITIEFLHNDDKYKITEIYEKYNEGLDNLACMLIKIQSDIIIEKLSSIEQEVMMKKLNTINKTSDIVECYDIIDKNYLNFIDEIKASNDIFK